MQNDPLKNHRRNVAAAEANLAKARAQLSAAAKRKGLSTAGILSSSKFVLRTTADRWAFEAERKGERAVYDVLPGIIDAIVNPGTGRFGHLARPASTRKPDPDQNTPPPPTPVEAAAGKLVLAVDNTTDTVNEAS